MALDEKEARTFRKLKLRLTNLEHASVAREKILEQLAQRAGVEIDLTRLATEEEEYAAELASKTGKHLLESEEVQAYLRESREGRDR